VILGAGAPFFKGKVMAWAAAVMLAVMMIALCISQLADFLPCQSWIKQ
jgi:hypothetical protein